MSHRAPCLLSRFACQGLMFDWLRWHTLNIATTTKRRGVDGTCTQLESVDESFNLKCQQWMPLQAAALAPHLSAQLICNFRAQMRPTQTCVTTVPLTQLSAVLCNNFPVVNAYFPLSAPADAAHATYGQNVFPVLQSPKSRLCRRDSGRAAFNVRTLARCSHNKYADMLHLS